MSKVYEAMMFAKLAHANQRRKYTNNPYFDHLAEVAGIVSSVTTNEDSLAVAFLHDTIEDCGATYETLADRFGCNVAHGVKLLSDIELGNRAHRKMLSRERLSFSPAWVQTIKCADLISNTSSIVEHDPKFATVYLEEKRMLLDVLIFADERLLKLARSHCEI